MISQRRLAAIMFTDLAGYSALTQRDERLALELVDIKRKLLSPLLAQHKGTVIKSLGDGLLIQFQSALQAVECAMTIQSMLKGYNISQRKDHKINVRIGIHLGDVEFQDGDVMGDGVNIASRIEPLAEPGGICISETIHDLVEGKLKAKFESLGKPELKNIEKEIEIFKVSSQEIEADNVITGADESKRSQLFKIGSVAAIGIVIILAAWLVLPDLFTPEETSSLAVLPFADLSPDQDLAYLSEGLAEEIRNAIGRIEGMNVIGRESSEIVKQRNLSTREAAALLDVQSVLEGSVQESGSRFRITARLIRGSDDTELWAAQFDREEGELFEIMDEIASDILVKLGYAIGPNDRIVGIGTTNIEAYKAYLEGRSEWNKRTEEGINNAISSFHRAKSLDPNYVEALIGLADSYFAASGYGFLSDDEGLSTSEQFILEAMGISDKHPAIFATLGHLYREYHHDWEQAQKYFLKAIDLDPNYPSSYHWYSITLRNMGRDREALLQAKHAYDLDPYSISIASNYAQQLGFEQRFDEAISVLNPILDLYPNSTNPYRALAEVHWGAGNWSIAEEVLKRGLQLSPNSGWLHYQLGLHHLWMGNFEVAEVEIEQARELIPSSNRILRGHTTLLIMSRNYEEAISLLKYAISVSPDFYNYYLDIAWAYYLSSEWANAMDAVSLGLDFVEPLDKTNKIALEATRGMLNAKQGNEVEVKNILKDLLKDNAFTERTSPIPIALIYASLGEVESVLDWIEIAYEHRSDFWTTINIHPVFDPFRQEPRFQALLERMGLAN